MLRSIHVALVTLLVAGSVGLAGEIDAQAAAPASEPTFRLQPGDAVRITVWRQPEFSGEFAVTTDGFLAHPLYRDVQVVGVPLGTVEAQLTEFLRRYVENPRFVIEPLIHVTVSGAVARPNVYSVRPGTSIVEVIAQAGGVTERGEPDRVRLIRSMAEQSVNLDDQRESRMPVQSGDEVFVDTRSQWFRSVIVPAATIVGAIASLVIAIRRD